MPSRSIVAFPLAVLFALAGCANPSRPRTPSAPAPGAAAATTLPRDNAAARPRDAFVLLSGGGTPLSNHFSQYVQAKAIAGWFQRACPPDSTWVFFGHGNREGQPATLADVRRDAKRDGAVVSSWLPGVLPNNRPATRESFLRALREEILPVVRGGGTLFLFVGDHGELAGERDKQESAITMWQLKRSRRRSSGWFTDAKEILGVAELRRILTAGLGSGQVVFCMTQCHGGGFHELGVAGEFEPPREWLTPAAAGSGASAARLRLPIAGYTATDEASPAAGCDPDPNPDQWAGYERFMPESLFGIDLLSGEPKGRACASLAEAHVAATLVDHTIDKPRSTSDHYLAAWADAIETRLAKTLHVTPAVFEAVAAYRRAVDAGEFSGRTELMRQRHGAFRQFTETLAQQVPDSARLLARGTRQELESAIAARPRIARAGRRGGSTELRRAWTDTLRPAWKAAVARGGLPRLEGAALEFEKHLLALEDEGGNYLFSRGSENTRLLSEIYWSSGYANPSGLDVRKAEATARWGAVRRMRVVAWGRAAADPAVRAAADKIGPGPGIDDGPGQRLTRQTAAERVLYYRRVLAAWEFLATMGATAALEELGTLIALERTPLPRSE